MKCYAIADCATAGDDAALLERVERLSGLSVEMIQLRAKSLDDRDLLELARACRARIGRDTRFVINGRADIALAVGADGVHLPSDGVPVKIVRRIGPDLMIGRSCHSVAEVQAASDEEVSFVVLGPVFDARSSRKSGAVDLRDLEEAARSAVEVYALGGFDRSRLGALSGTGVAGVAAITMFMRDEPIDQIVASVHEASTA